MSIWQDVPENDECVEKETKLSNIIDLKHVLTRCCKESDLWFQIIDSSPTTWGFRVVCKSCEKVGEVTRWSWERAISLWNVSLWNPEYMGRDPLKLADRIEKLELTTDEIMLGDIVEVAEILKEAPKYLRKGVYETEEAGLEPYMIPEEEGNWN